MFLSAQIVTGVVAALHVYFMVLEMFLWTKPAGLRAFGLTLPQAQASRTLAANQGLYNGFLALGLIWSLVYPSQFFAREIALFFLGCVIAAGLYGGFTASRKILGVQALPAAIGFILMYLATP